MKRYLATFAAGAFFPSLVVLGGGMHPSAAAVSSAPATLVAHQDEDVAEPVRVEIPDSQVVQQPQLPVSSSPFPPSPPVVAKPLPPTTTLSPAPAHIAANVDQGVDLMNQAIAKTPAAIATMTQAAAEHGLAAFAYDVPEVKKQTDELGRLIGGSLRAFAEALRDDMVKTARESGVGRKP